MDYRKSLLKENRKALQFLHDSYGFDFQKPCLIARIDGKFTHKSVMDTVKKHSEEKCKVVVFVQSSDKYRVHSLRAVVEDRGRFSIDIPRGYYGYNIDSFYGVGDFEETRKHKTAYAYIIAQSVSFMTTPREKETIQLNARYRIAENGVRLWGDGRGNTYIGSVTLLSQYGGPEKLEYSDVDRRYYAGKRFSDNILDYVDKSGYLVWNVRKELRRAAKALKAERDAQAAENADYSERQKAIEDRMETAKEKFCPELIRAETAEDFNLLQEKLRILKSIAWSLDYAKNYKFSSVEAKENYYKGMENELDNLFKLKK